jgi:Poly (ADP-ribose) glycohydrolase (PARG)
MSNVSAPKDATVFEGIANFDDFEIVVLQIQEEACSVHSLQHLRQFLETNNEMENFFANVLPSIVCSAKSIGPLCNLGIPLSTSTNLYKFQFSYSEVASILSNFFLCTFTDRWTFDTVRNLSPASLIRLFGPNGEEKESLDLKMGKISMLYYGYFQRIDAAVEAAASFGRDYLTLERNVVAIDTEFWASSDEPLGKMNLVSDVIYILP